MTPSARVRPSSAAERRRQAAPVYCAAFFGPEVSAHFFNWLKKKPLTGRLALQSGAGALAYAHLTWQDERPALLACASGPIATDAGKPWATLADLPQPASLVLAPGEYQLLPIDAPQVPPKELTLAVRWRIKDLIDFPLDEATVDVLRLGTGTAERGNKLLAVVARNDLLRRYLALASQSDVTLATIDIPELAQRNLAARLETPGRALAVLSLTPQGGLLTVSCDGELCFHRRMQFTPDSLAPTQAEPALQRLALELQRSLDYIERHHGTWRLDRIVLAPPPVSASLLPFLREHLYLPLELADLTQVFDGSLPEPSTLASCWFALGGALRRDTVGL